MHGFNSTCNHAPPLPPRATPGTSLAVRARGGELSEVVCVPGVGVGQIRNRSNETRLLRQFNEQRCRRKIQSISLKKSVLMTLHHKYCVCVCEVVSV